MTAAVCTCGHGDLSAEWHADRCPAVPGRDTGQDELLADGPVRHEHTLPSAEGLRPGAVARCGCGRYFVLDPIPWERTWRRVAPWPWDRRARRAIAAALAAADDNEEGR